MFMSISVHRDVGNGLLNYKGFGNYHAISNLTSSYIHPLTCYPNSLKVSSRLPLRTVSTAVRDLEDPANAS